MKDVRTMSLWSRITDVAQSMRGPENEQLRGHLMDIAEDVRSLEKATDAMIRESANWRPADQQSGAQHE